MFKKCTKSSSALVLKLLSKTPEERYSSAYGISADLKQCLAAWTNEQQIADFVPGQHDVPFRFQISQKLYGRDADIDALLSLAGCGQSSVTLVVLASMTQTCALAAITARRPWLAITSTTSVRNTPHCRLVGSVAKATMPSSTGIMNEASLGIAHLPWRRRGTIPRTTRSHPPGTLPGWSVDCSTCWR